MEKVGDYKWNQLSMWDFSPDCCIETYVTSNDGKHVFHYYLTKVIEVINDRRYRTEVVISAEGVPEDVINWRNGEIHVKPKSITL